MDLKLYDTLARAKRPFKPLDPDNVRMYVCGPTVYDFAHIGNARPVIVFDVLFRLLRHIYGTEHVTYVRNITDVDDKINARAAQDYPNLPLNQAIHRLTEKTERQFHQDIRALRVLTAENVNKPGQHKGLIEPRATDHIAEMRALIELLVSSRHAYVSKSHVLFNVSSWKAADGLPEYGKLSGRSLDEMIAGARIEVAPYKDDPRDFVLWKPSKKHEPAWPSPAKIKRNGRPGWHIECSAMSAKYLGEMFDIHGGGSDLVFPHHENEIAQSRCSFDTPMMANYWVHNGFLEVNGAKMSKSLGNFYSIRQLLRTKDFGGRRWSGEVLRFAMLQTHYREPIDWTVRLLEQTDSRLTRWKEFASERTVRRKTSALFEKFVETLADDLNTPAAFRVVESAIESGSDEDRFTVYNAMKFLNFKTPKTRVASIAEQLQRAISRLGTLSENDWGNLSRAVVGRPTFRSGALKPETKLFAALKAIEEFSGKMRKQFPNLSQQLHEPAAQFLSQMTPAESEFELKVRRLISKRNEAREVRDFAESDRIRDELKAMRIVIKDTKEGTTWEPE
jgi:cysteinyl-tRNA synthetase